MTRRPEDGFDLAPVYTRKHRWSLWALWLVDAGLLVGGVIAIAVHQ